MIAFVLDANRQHAIGSKFHRIAGHVLCLDIHMFESLNRVVNLLVKIVAGNIKALARV